ncbi:MAG: TauD/TfdA family dioxygenase, partial [Deltaproteobacteria bacterium]|nr:TauD/TfdA family dioxygenase [Deltaproteobacteria bacterium]
GTVEPILTDPTLAATRLLVASIRSRLDHAEGFVVVTGLSDMALTHGERKAVYQLLGTMLGEPTGSYGVLYEVCDRGGSYRNQAIPVSMTRASTGFHTDSSRSATHVDVVGLLCQQPAVTGGDSFVSNVLRCHEWMRQHEPGLLEQLYRPVLRDIVTPETDGGLESLRANRFPVFSRSFTVCGTRALRLRYMRYWIERGHARAGEPLPARYLEALDVLDHQLARADHHLRFRLGAGDMLWVNNWRVAHHRTRYVDDPSCPRTMVRMWLRYRGP